MSVSKNKMINGSNSNIVEEKKEEFTKLFNNNDVLKIKEQKNEDERTNNEPNQNNLSENTGYMINTENLQKRNPIIYILITIVSLIIIFLSIVVCYNVFYKKTFSNMYVEGVNISNLTKEEAISKINEEFMPKLEEEMLIKCEDKEHKFNVSDIGVEYDTKQAVEEIYRIGRGRKYNRK